MKRITLIRHAKVDIANDKALSAQELSEWVRRYDVAPIDKYSLPSSEVEELVAKADVLVASSLWRTEASALALGRLPYEKNELFNEAAIPEIDMPFLKLKPKTWLVILRLMLLLRLGKKESSLNVSKAQAKKAAKRLEELSFYDDSVVLIGHGGMNWLIHKALLQNGWELEGKISYKNWGTITLKRKEDR